MWRSPRAGPLTSGGRSAPVAPPTEGDLFAFLGNRRLDLVRVVMVQLLDDSHSFDELQIRCAGEVQQWVAESVPAPRMDARRGGDRGHPRCAQINLVTGVTGLSRCPRRSCRGAGMSPPSRAPEDRPDPGASECLRASRRQPPRGRGSVDGAWWPTSCPGPASGPFDDIDGDASVVLGKALVIRSTVRALVGDRIVRRAGSRCTLPRAHPRLAGSRGSAPLLTGQSDVIIHELLRWLDEVDESAAGASAHSRCRRVSAPP